MGGGSNVNVPMVFPKGGKVEGCNVEGMEGIKCTL